jgi:hypothetical protein
VFFFPTLFIDFPVDALLHLIDEFFVTLQALINCSIAIAFFNASASLMKAT